MLFVYLSSLALFLACSNQDLDLGDSGGNGDTANEEKVVLGTQAASLQIQSGEAKGSRVEIPKGALPEGAELSMEAVAAPKSFGVSGATTASAPIQIAAKKADGSKAVLAQPMSVAINVPGLTLAADAVKENLCVLIAGDDDVNVVYRNYLLNIDVDKKEVQLRIKVLGILQAVYCGDDKLDGFKEAGETEVIAPPPGVEEKDVSTFGKREHSLSLSFDTSLYGSGTQLCIIVGQNGDFFTPGREDEVNETRYFATAAMPLVEGVNEGKMTLNTQKLADAGEFYLLLLVQGEGEVCPEAADKIKTKPDFKRAYLFPFDKAGLSGDGKIVMASAPLGITQLSVDTKVPATSERAGYFPQTDTMCVIAEVRPDKKLSGLFLLNESLDVNGNFSGGTESISVPVPGTWDKSHSTLFMRVGQKCQSLSKVDFSKSHDLNLSRTTETASGTYSLSALNLNLEQLGKVLPSTIKSKVACLGLYPHKYEGTTRDFNQSLLTIDWELSLSIQTLLPWSNDYNYTIFIPLLNLASLAADVTCSNEGNISGEKVGYPVPVVVPVEQG